MPANQRSIRLQTFIFISTSLIFLAASALTAVFVNSHLRKYALREAEQKERILLDRNLATHTYFTHRLKPKVFDLLATLPGPQQNDYFEPAWMSSTYAVREIDGYFKELNPSEYYYKEAAINARSPENEADDYERAFLEEVNANPELEIQSEIRTIENEPYFSVLRRGETMEQSCLRCHSTPENAPAGLLRQYGSKRSFHRQPGETSSAISIRVPLAVAYAGARQISVNLLKLLTILFLGLLVLQLSIMRHVMLRPLESLQQRIERMGSSDGPSSGHAVSLPFGHELRELTLAFNSMSQQVRQRNRELQLRNDELSALNEQLQQESRQRLLAEKEVRQYQQHLEERVAERTRQLSETTTRLGREIAERSRMADAFQRLVKGTASETGTPFFETVVQELAEWLGTRWALISEIDPKRPDRAQPMVFWNDGKLSPADAYDLQGTPCNNVRQRGFCLYSEEILDKFPDDAMLAQLGVKWYAGIPLKALDGQILGILCALHDRPLHTPPNLAEVFTIFSERLSAEIERKRIEDRIRTMNEELERRVEQRTEQLQQQTFELIHARDTAEKANKAKSRFLANVTHELRTPLNIVLGFAQLMGRDSNLTMQQQEHLNTINHSGTHLLALIDNVLQFNRLESGKLSLNRQPFDLYLLLDTLEGMMRLAAEQKGLSLIFERSGEVPKHIMTDKGKLHQILINLIDNAVKFTEKGEVRLSVTRMQCSERTGWHADKNTASEPRIAITEYCLSFLIRDTGPGIAAEEMDTLFEVFTQTESGRKTEQGTGLGLALSRQLIQLLGGDISVNSEKDRGCEFQIVLPLEPAQDDDISALLRRDELLEATTSVPAAKKNLPESPIAITPELTAQWPEEILTRLQSVLLQGDVDEIEDCIETLRPSHPLAADALMRLAGKFAYGELLKAISQKSTQGGNHS